jgi:orotate phosphoribosyltransferase
MEIDQLARRVGEVAQLSGEFRLRSGLTAETYFDKYQFESDPVLLHAIAGELVALIPPGTEILAGLELGGIPVVTALSLASGLPAVFVRKAAKSYGTAKLAEGPSIDGRNVLVVEDVVTTGGQVVASTTDLRNLGAIVTTALCVIDREQGGTDALAAGGIALRSLFTRSDIERSRGAHGHAPSGHDGL